MSAYREPPVEMQVDRDIVQPPEPVKPSGDELYERLRDIAERRRLAHAAWQTAYTESQAQKRAFDALEGELRDAFIMLDSALREGR
jgi:hypothetical protein